MFPPPYEIVQIQLPVIAAGTDGRQDYLWALPYDGVVESVQFLPSQALTAHDTNYTDLSVEVGGTEIASEQTTTGDTGNLVAGTEISAALLVSGTSLEVTSGDAIEFIKTDAGTGVAFSGTAVIKVRIDRNGVG